VSTFRGRRLAGHSALYGLAGALGKALALLTVPVLSRLLTPSAYGLADLATTLAAMLAMVAMFAGDIPAARLAGRADTPEERRLILSSYVWATMVSGLLIAVALVPFATIIASGLWASPGSTGVVLMVLTLIPISTAQASLITTYRIDARPVEFALLGIVDLLSQMGLAVLFVVLGWGAIGVVAGFVAGSIVGLVAVAVARRSLLVPLPDWRLCRTLIAEGISFLPAALGFVAASYAVRFLVVDSLGPDAVGQFAVATRLAGGMALATAAFSMAWGPFGLALPDSAHTAQLFGRVLRSYAAVAVLAALAIGSIAPELVTVVSGQDYADAARMLPGLLLAAAMAGGFYLLLVAAGISRRGSAVAFAAIAGALVQVSTSAVLLRGLGLQAVGVGALLGQAVALIILVAAVRSSVHGGVGAVVALCAGGVLAAFLQVLNTTPDGTMVLRLIISAVSAITGLWLFLRLVRQTPASSPGAVEA
jgi:O-antigen/teichoic acid export membrane protein